MIVSIGPDMVLKEDYSMCTVAVWLLTAAALDAFVPNHRFIVTSVPAAFETAPRVTSLGTGALGAGGIACLCRFQNTRRRRIDLTEPEEA